MDDCLVLLAATSFWLQPSNWWAILQVLIGLGAVIFVHELGHFLGAGHSTDFPGVMRPQLGDGQARRRGFKLKFDPANTLLMSLIGEQLRTNPLCDVRDLPAFTRTRLRQIYAAMATAAPSDPLAARYLQLLR